MNYKEHSVGRNQHRIYVRVYAGDDPAIILMHGFPDNLHLYDRVVSYLSPPRRTVTFDFLGWGASDKPSDYSYTAKNQLTELDTVIKNLALERVALVAHDASGPPAIDWALDHAGRVAGLVLLNTYADAAAAGGDIRVLHPTCEKNRTACLTDVRQPDFPQDVLLAARKIF